MHTGFIGLGAMGQGMAANLQRAGYLSGVWNRTLSRGEVFAAAHGVPLAPSPGALARDCECLISCVSADGDLRQVLEALLPELGPGQVLVDCSTVSVSTAREIGAQVNTRGAAFLDAPVSGGVEGARNATLAMMVGGDAEVLARVRPVLETLAARVAHMGPIGAGQATKAVNQIMAAGINQAVSEALAFGAAQGLDLTQVIEILSQGAAGNWFLSHRGPRMQQGQFAPGFRVALHHKDLRICQAMAEAAGVHLSVVDRTLADYQQLMAQGHGDEDISALFRLKQALFPPHE